jgi:hypothetical protein
VLAAWRRIKNHPRSTRAGSPADRHLASARFARAIASAVSAEGAHNVLVALCGLGRVDLAGVWLGEFSGGGLVPPPAVRSSVARGVPPIEVLPAIAHEVRYVLGAPASTIVGLDPTGATTVGAGLQRPRPQISCTSSALLRTSVLRGTLPTRP